MENQKLCVGEFLHKEDDESEGHKLGKVYDGFREGSLMGAIDGAEAEWDIKSSSTSGTVMG